MNVEAPRIGIIRDAICRSSLGVFVDGVGRHELRLLVRADDLTVCTLSICNANRHIGLALLLSGQYLHMKDALPGVAAWRSLSWELSEGSFTSVKRKC